MHTPHSLRPTPALPFYLRGAPWLKEVGTAGGNFPPRPAIRLGAASLAGSGSRATTASDQVRAIAVSQDREAFAGLFRHFAPRVKTYLMRLGANASVAEDLAQETMMTVWRKAAYFDPSKAECATWIFTIARNLRIDAIRRERRPEIDPDDPLIAPAPELRPDERLNASRREERIREALANLPAEQALVVRLSFYEDKPHREIEQDLGIPLGTVKSRLRLAMLRLRSMIGDDS